MRHLHIRFAAIAVALLSFGLRAQAQGSNETAYDTNPNPDLSWVPHSILSLRLAANISLSKTPHLFWTISEQDIKGADIVLLRKNATGGVYLTDMEPYGCRKPPTANMSQDLELITATQTDTVTAFVFKRKIDTHSETFAYHGPDNRVARDVWLWDPENNFVQFVAPADVQTLVLRLSSKPYQIPMEGTLYSGAGNETQCAHFSANPDNYKRVFNPCGDVWAEWALGQGSLIMPNDVGKRFGNDSFYSPTLRKYDMGTLTLGTNFPLIKILHKWGKEISAKIVRNGREIIEFQNKSWDNGFQSIQKMVCNYDTTKSNETIVGGWATYSEMCYLFLSYYPAVSFPNCLPLAEDGTTECYYAGKSKRGLKQLPPGLQALPSDTNAPGAMCPAPFNVTATPPAPSSPSPSKSSNSTPVTGKPGSSVWWKPSCATQVWAVAAVAAAAMII
ncbi:hypothetical protein M427DRAFT_134829 [Gonapodya prolifera JEL478]|uniref:Copper type II ascorbate-dependent monooxygenase C-terminal domain-containing protein n=1 Tax=Gonapodya prolifera (strain JEL478) TaxID=1344416 RepID=A0A139AG71_GONPJ|nr:hypothetical protein M427DRAFT_134829 [Gonapodya prolifera JEL478]|eukprot:KXS15796.1 hypothetical protein M427DRAFT_134829 [Gonapodya prolifera JEL478]